MNNTMIMIGVIIIAIGSAYYYLDEKTANQTELKPGEQMSFFVTSKNPGSGANFGGLAGADQYCTKLAEESGITGKVWKAYLSASENGKVVNARERIGQGPWYNFNGIIVARNLQELHSESNLANNINKQTALSERGDIISGRGDKINMHDLLTGSDASGKYVATTTDTTCKNWTSSSTGSAILGHHDRVGIDDSLPMKSWNSSHLSKGCSLEALKTTGGSGLFYCFAISQNNIR